MNTFNGNQFFKGIKKKTMSNTRYANLADTDLNEEVIVKLLSDFIVGNTTTPLDEELGKLQNTLENLLFNKNNLIQNVIQFNSTFAEPIETEKVTEYGKDAKTYRQVTNYIANKIEQNELIENCK